MGGFFCVVVFGVWTLIYIYVWDRVHDETIIKGICVFVSMCFCVCVYACTSFIRKYVLVLDSNKKALSAKLYNYQ